MDKQPLVDIVIPVYNRAGVVTATLDSVAAQTARPLRLILVDNNSTDDTPGVLQRWKEAHATDDFPVDIVSEKQPGAAAARNAGLARVTAPWVMFFDSDDLMRPGHVERALKVSAEHPQADIVAWDFTYHTAGGREHRRPFIMSDMLYNNIMHSSFSTQRFMVRTELVRRVGGWLSESHMFDDCELGVRLLLQNPVVVHAGNEITVDVLETPDSLMTAPEGRVERMKVALDSIRLNLPADKKHWADLQRLIMVSTWARHDPEAPALARELLAEQPAGRRLLWRLLRAYLLAGGRGAARIYRLLTSLRFYI